MTRALLFIALSLYGFCTHAASGVNYGGYNWANDAETYIGCGDGLSITLAVWSSTSISEITVNEVKGLPSGWSFTACGNNCITISLDHSTAARVELKWSNAGSEIGSAYLNISRLPTNRVINGPSTVCGTETFTFAGANYTGSPSWSSSNTAVLTINSSTGVATKVGTGTAVVTATVNSNCGFVATSKTVFCGNPSAIGNLIVRMGPSEYQLCQNATLGIAVGNSNHSTQQVTQYNWSAGSWSSYATGYDFGGLNATSIRMFNLSSSAPSSETIYVTAQNACGSSPLYSKTFFKINCGSFRVAYPNPVSDILSLGFEESNEKLPISIKLYSEKTQKIVYTLGWEEIEKSVSREHVLNIPVNELPRGDYFLHFEAEQNRIEKTKITIQ